MPWKAIGNTVYKNVAGKWVKKQTCGSAAKAQAAVRLLYADESQEKAKPRRRIATKRGKIGKN
jgi:hypothetical protein